MPQADLTFLKLGGSLITDKDRPSTPRRDVLARLADEIAAALHDAPSMRLLVGHGSGSFGHSAARRHGTRAGVQGVEGWRGFAEVWKEARALNQIVVEALAQAGLPVIAFPPSASVVAANGQIQRWDLASLRAALDAGLLPLINGDTIIDTQRGGTILSTEDLFIYLAHQLAPGRILLTGLEDGVWADFPARLQLISYITPQNFPTVAAQIGGSASVDVTGGMIEKVRSMLGLTEMLPRLQSVIFSGGRPGLLRDVLAGKPAGTTIAKDVQPKH
jgi:isopentenyl phosphate kinase